MKTSMWIRLVLLTAVSLHLSACGKSKSDGVSVQTAPQAEEPQNQGDSAPTNGEKSDDLSSGDESTSTTEIPAGKVPTVIKSDDKKGGSSSSTTASKKKIKRQTRKLTNLQRSLEKKLKL